MPSEAAEPCEATEIAHTERLRPAGGREPHVPGADFELNVATQYDFVVTFYPYKQVGAPTNLVPDAKIRLSRVNRRCGTEVVLAEGVAPTDLIPLEWASESHRLLVEHRGRVWEVWFDDAMVVQAASPEVPFLPTVRYETSDFRAAITSIKEDLRVRDTFGRDKNNGNTISPYMWTYPQSGWTIQAPSGSMKHYRLRRTAAPSFNFFTAVTQGVFSEFDAAVDVRLLGSGEGVAGLLFDYRVDGGVPLFRFVALDNAANLLHIGEKAASGPSWTSVPIPDRFLSAAIGSDFRKLRVMTDEQSNSVQILLNDVPVHTAEMVFSGTSSPVGVFVWQGTAEFTNFRLSGY